MKQKIFIDTDMGNDDIMAIAYLLNEPTIEIIGIATVNGVSTKENGYINLKRILSFLDKDIPVYLGSQEALKEKQAQFPKRDIDRANSLTLLNKLPVPDITTNLEKKTIPVEKYIFQKTVDNNVTILALGPLTNIAKTIERYGEKFTKNVKEIVIMGGGIKCGNVSPDFLAEYNIWLDPEAAKVVFSSNIPIMMVGINATDCVKVTDNFKQQVDKINPMNKNGKLIKEIIINNDGDFNAFYDPLSAYLLSNKSAIAEKLQCGINVLLQGKRRGKTVITKKRNNVSLVLAVSGSMFYQKQLDILRGSEK